MSLRFRDNDDDSTRNTVLGVVAGALAGFAIGMLVAKKFGGIEGLTSAIRKRATSAAGRNGTGESPTDEVDEEDDFDDLDGDGPMGEDYDEALEERVLTVFRTTPFSPSVRSTSARWATASSSWTGRSRARLKPSTRSRSHGEFLTLKRSSIASQHRRG